MSAVHRTHLDRSATFSSCGSYRYSLERLIPGVDGPNLCWLMLNPSTADDKKDDATIRKVVGFTRRHGYGVALVVNLFAWRARDPREVLHNLADAEGPLNCTAIMHAAELSDAVVCAWGATKWAQEHAWRVLDWLHNHPTKQVRFLCLGKTKDGSPRHPLFVPYAQPLLGFP